MTMRRHARTPRTLWVELTSKCPLDCVFCSRKTVRGSGQHMPYGLFESLVNQVQDPRTFLLNYSGESTVYPDLIKAIRLARSTGAGVELVSALVNVSESLLGELSRSGLTRLTVSLHAVDPDAYAAIYRYGSFGVLKARLVRFLELCRDVRGAPATDLAFVAMDQNLAELPSVAAFAECMALRDISIFPVIRRDAIAEPFSRELTVLGDHRPQFREHLNDVVASLRGEHPNIAFPICNPTFHANGHELGEVPIAFPEPLPAGARIHSCEQNPWETAHVLSNGDVVACEVLDKRPLGNLAEQSLDEIWNGAAYETFRRAYQQGNVPECRACPWKTAYRPGPIRSDIIGAHGGSAQLLHGWHSQNGEPHIWSTQQAQAVLAPRDNSRSLHLNGLLPTGSDGDANELGISCNGRLIGVVSNPHSEVLAFGVDFDVPDSSGGEWLLEFRTRHVYRPSERGTGSDRRDLGFALNFVTSKRHTDTRLHSVHRAALRKLKRLIQIADRGGAFLPKFRPFAFAPANHGLSVIIPERDSVPALSVCLDSIIAAATKFAEPVEVIVVVNGSQASAYRNLQRAHGAVRWQFHAEPLAFSKAIAQGLRCATFDWVYLLNNDVVLDPNTFRSIATCRKDDVFSIGSQIVLNDSTRFRDETNWTTLLIEDGLVTTHDRIPQSDAVEDSFYSGGGASMFQTQLLRSVLDEHVYHPFYWEDVEWGWRARKLGYRSVFCSQSIAHHERQATVGRYFTSSYIEAVLARNRLLFQLRNLTSVGSLSRAMDEAAQIADAAFFVTRDAWGQIIRGRLWNHRAPVSDAEVVTTKKVRAV